MLILDRELDPLKLSKGERRIAEYVTKNQTALLYTNTTEIADDLGLSTATVSRFWKNIGFEGFKDFKDALRKSIEAGSPSSKMKDILTRVDEQSVFDVLSTLVNQNMKHTAEWIDQDVWDEAVHLLNSDKRVNLFAIGAATTLNELLSFRLNRLGILTRECSSTGSAVLESIVNLDADDLVVVFSFSHVHPEHKVIFDYCRKHTIKSLLITDLFTSELIPQADVVLHVERGEIWEFHSMVAPILLVESLIVSLARLNESKALEKLDTLTKLRKEYRIDLPH